MKAGVRISRAEFFRTPVRAAPAVADDAYRRGKAVDEAARNSRLESP